MKKPNFYILGAPKCGTTSVYEWLKSHKDVYMSPVKEPCYFNTDEDNRNVKSIKKYESLFEGAEKHHKIVGEASVWYLGSKEAVSNIKKYSPKSKFLVCVRNPVEMAVSLHEQQLFSGNEYIEEFEDAWRAQVDRKGGKKISYWTREYKHLIYGEVCKLGEQIERLIDNVSFDRVKIVLLEDLKRNTKKEYKKILNFLNIDTDFNCSLRTKNKGGKKRVSRTIKLIERSIHNFKNYMGVYVGAGIGEMISKKNKKNVKRNSVNSVMIREMKNYFKKDVKKLESIIKKDLSHWV